MYAKKIIHMVAAVNDVGGIGLDGAMPWHDPVDLKWFNHITQQTSVIMGRKTYDSFPQKIIARDQDAGNREFWCWTRSGLTLGEMIAGAKFDIITIAGGAQLYRQASTIIDRFIITRIRGLHPVDTIYPLALPWSDR